MYDHCFRWGSEPRVCEITLSAGVSGHFRGRNQGGIKVRSFVVPVCIPNIFSSVLTVRVFHSFLERFGTFRLGPRGIIILQSSSTNNSFPSTVVLLRGNRVNGSPRSKTLVANRTQCSQHRQILSSVPFGKDPPTNNILSLRPEGT